jgi:hypothetical protein
MATLPLILANIGRVIMAAENLSALEGSKPTARTGQQLMGHWLY